jgi:thiamine-phosphate pyrophosphorylase
VIKALRHELGAALGSAGVDAGVLLASRDTPGDVGTGIATETEGRRAGIRDVAAAASARLGEALRSIEEAVKVLGGDAAAIERSRYTGYEAGKRLVLAFGAGSGVQWRVCVLITEALCALPWEDVARRAIEGGADCLQLREKGLGDRDLLGRARRLVALGRASGRGVSIVVNDRVDIALLAGADGVHLGQDDLGVEDARRVAGFSLLVGVSTENLEQARRAARAGADYCGVGPMFTTSTKDKPRIAGPAYLREYLADEVAGARPHLAIGGITPRSIGELAAAGCRGVAVASCVCGSPDPAGVCRDLAVGLPGGSRAGAS